jgi:Zn finger protein HypA/HybF involved in hydrogenase expression
MDVKQLAEHLWPQISDIARKSGFTIVRRVDVVVGSRLGVDEEALEAAIEPMLYGTDADGATINVRVVQPGQTLKAPGRSDNMTATGFDILITRIEGDRRE